MFLHLCVSRSGLCVLAVCAALLSARPFNSAAAQDRATPPDNVLFNLRYDGVLAEELNDAQKRVVLSLLLLARDTLAGVDGSGRGPWPCTDAGRIAGFLPNSLAAYQRLRDGLVQQGFVLEREVAAQGGDVQTFQLRRGALTLMGIWGKAFAGPRSTLALCEQAKNWRPAPPPKPAANAPALGQALTGRVPRWSLGARALRVRTRRPEEDAWRLLAVGEIGADGRFSLPLPRASSLARADLRPVRALLESLDISCDAWTGKLDVSEPRASTLVFQDIDLLRSGPLLSAQAKHIDDLPRQGTLINTVSGPAEASSRLFIVFTDRPVTLRGQLTCSGEQRTVGVQLALPGGWSAFTVTETLRDDGGVTTLLEHPVPGRIQEWALLNE